MDTCFTMQLHTEQRGRFTIKIQKQSIEFMFEDGSSKSVGSLTRAELKDLAKICHFSWENSAALMRPSKESPNESNT